MAPEVAEVPLPSTVEDVEAWLYFVVVVEHEVASRRVVRTWYKISFLVVALRHTFCNMS